MASNDEGLTPFQDAMLSEGLIDTSPEASNDDVRGELVFRCWSTSHEPHVVFSLSDEAQAARQSEAAQALDDAKAQGLGNEAQIRAVLKALGLS